MGVREFIENHPEDILTGISSLCTIGAVIAGGFDTLKAQKKKAELLEKNPEATNKDILKVCAPCYVRSALVVSAGIGTGIASRRMSAKRIAELTATSAALGIAATQKFKKYREVVAERLGEEEEKDFYEEAEKRAVTSKLSADKEGTIMVHEEISDTWTRMTYEEVLKGIIRAQTEYMENSYAISAHDLVYDILGVSYDDLKGSEDDYGYDDYSGECVYGYFGIPFDIEEIADDAGGYLNIGYYQEPHAPFDGENWPD